MYYETVKNLKDIPPYMNLGRYYYRNLYFKTFDNFYCVGLWVMMSFNVQHNYYML